MDQHRREQLVTVLRYVATSNDTGKWLIREDPIALLDLLDDLRANQQERADTHDKIKQLVQRYSVLSKNSTLISTSALDKATMVQLLWKAIALALWLLPHRHAQLAYCCHCMLHCMHLSESNQSTYLPFKIQKAS